MATRTRTGRLELGRKRPGYVQEPDDGTLAAEIEEQALILAIEALPGEGGAGGPPRAGPDRSAGRSAARGPASLSTRPEAALEEIADLTGEEGLEEA